jgi:hypothetical protein
MIRFVLFVFLSLVSGLVASESLLGRVSECPDKDSAFDRLAGCDRVVEDFGLDKKSHKAAVSPGKWAAFSTVSDFDDAVSYYVSLKSVSEVSIGVYRKVTPVLTVACSNGQLSGFINWSYYLGLGSVAARFRFDKNRAYMESWDTYGDHKAMFFPDDARNLVKRLVAHNKLLVQVAPFSELPVMAEFNIAGLSSHLDEIKAHCYF